MRPELLSVQSVINTALDGGGEILPLNIARAKAVSTAVPVSGTETVDLMAAAGRVCARPRPSPINLPPFSNSAMDGYAVRTIDFKASGPWRFPVSGRIAAGDSGIGLFPRESAVRIFTGAPVPSGFDAVVMQENCQRSGEGVVFSSAPRKDQNIRLAGEDVAAGDAVAPVGTLLTPARIALAAATGTGTLDVYRQVRIGLISTGSELREPGQSLDIGQIYNSNRYFLRSALARPWVDIRDFGIVADDPEAIRAAVRTAAETCDIVITTGGVSVGEEDHMMDALRRENATLEVLKVAMRPGKPVSVGKIGGALFFGLPGNPYAAAVTFAQIALPAIKATAGFGEVHSLWMPAVSGFHCSRKPGRTEHVPVSWSQRDQTGRPIVEMLGRGSSASLSPFAMAMAIAILPPELTSIEPGMPLRIEPLCDQI